MNTAYETLDRDILQILWDSLPSGFFEYGLNEWWGPATLLFLFIVLVFFSVPFYQLYEDEKLFSANSLSLILFCAATYPFFIFTPSVPTAKLSEPIPASYGEEVTRHVKDYAAKHNIDQTLALSRLNLAMNCPGHWEIVEPKGNVCPKAMPVRKWEDIFFRIKRIESSWPHRNFIKSEGELRADRPD